MRTTTTPIPSILHPAAPRDRRAPRRSGRLTPALASVISVSGLYAGVAVAETSIEVPPTTVVPGTSPTTAPEPVGQFWLLPEHGPAGTDVTLSGSCGWGGDHVRAELFIGNGATTPVETKTVDLTSSQIFFHPSFLLPTDLLPGESVRVHVSCSSGFEGDRVFVVDEYLRIAPRSGPRDAPIQVHGACNAATVATLVIGGKDPGPDERSSVVSATPVFDAELFVPPALPVAAEVWIRATCDDRVLPAKQYHVEGSSPPEEPGVPCGAVPLEPAGVAPVAVVEPSFTG